MTRTINSVAAFFAPIALIAGLASPALAAETQVSAKVVIGDLNLATKAGKAVLALRAERAATELCRGDAADWHTANGRDARRCADEIKAEIMTKAMSGSVQLASR